MLLECLTKLNKRCGTTSRKETHHGPVIKKYKNVGLYYNIPIFNYLCLLLLLTFSPRCGFCIGSNSGHIAILGVNKQGGNDRSINVGTEPMMPTGIFSGRYLAGLRGMSKCSILAGYQSGNHAGHMLNGLGHPSLPELFISQPTQTKTHKPQLINQIPQSTTYTPDTLVATQLSGPQDSTFVSSHYRMLSSDITSYLDRKRLEYLESPIKLTLKFCPFCPPHRYKSDNLWKHEIFKNSGNSYCHRCGYKGSIFDFKRAMGDLPSVITEDNFLGNVTERCEPPDRKSVV